MFDRPAEGRQKKVFFYRPHVYDIAGVPRRNVFVERCVSPFVAKKQLRHVRDQLGVPRGWMVRGHVLVCEVWCQKHPVFRRTLR